MAIEQKELLDLLLAKYTAKFHSARLNYENYLTGSVGVGEHPDIVAECESLLCEMLTHQEMCQFLIITQAKINKTKDAVAPTKEKDTDDE